MQMIDQTKTTTTGLILLPNKNLDPKERVKQTRKNSPSHSEAALVSAAMFSVDVSQQQQSQQKQQQQYQTGKPFDSGGGGGSRRCARI